ncbi:MAG: HIT domain-containing protein [Chloroflexi bacterium]|nr:HIT domain-containing protein [Chloroflexota bacterium]
MKRLRIGNTLFKISRGRLAAPFIGFAFAHLTAVMPLNKITETEQFTLFHHPQPTWDTHLLAVPKQSLRSFASLDLQDRLVQEMITAVFQTMHKTAADLKLRPYTLLINGGAYQDVPQLHWHLLNDPVQPDIEPVELPSEQAISQRYGQALSYEHPQPTAPFHHLLNGEADALLDVLALAQMIVEQQQLPAFRLSLNGGMDMATSTSLSTGVTPLIFHLQSDDIG